MASAPRPGVGARKEATRAAQNVLVIPYDGSELRLAWQNLPIGERVICRKATGLPFETFTQSFEDTQASVVGEDSLCVAWWLARRASGEFALTFTKACEEWDVTKLGVVRVDEPEGDDPEA